MASSFFDVTNDLVSFSHMSGLLVRHDGRWPWWIPTAEVPIIAASSRLMTDGGVSLASVWPCLSSRL